MTSHQNTSEKDRIAHARESFSGRLLTDHQFTEAITITRIVEREIIKSGAFKDKLADYAHAYARTERFDTAKAETTLRDLFKHRTGLSMNEMRKKLMEQENNLPDTARHEATRFAEEALAMVEHGNKMTFHRAQAHQAKQLARHWQITDAAAKQLMRDSYHDNHGRDFHEIGKELNERFYRPQIEAEKQQRGQSRNRSTNGRSHTGKNAYGEVAQSYQQMDNAPQQGTVLTQQPAAPSRSGSYSRS